MGVGRRCRQITNAHVIYALVAFGVAHPWTEGISRFVISISYDTDEPAQNYDPSENIQCIDSQSNDVDIAGGLT